MVIEKNFPSNPLVIIRFGVLFVQKWSSFQKDSDQELIAKIVDKIQVWLGGYTLSNMVVCKLFNALHVD
jgi:hypothetical protein